MRGVAFAKQVIADYGTDKVGQLSAALAYGAIFSIGPLLLVLISFISFAYGADAAQGKLFSELSGTFGAATAQTIEDVVAHSHKSGGSVLALVFGVVGMLLGAAGIATQLQNSFNGIFSIVPDPDGGIARTILIKCKNVILVLVGGLVVVTSLVLSTIISGIGANIQEQLHLPPITLELFNSLISLLVFVGLLFYIYRALPDVVIPKKVVATAAVCVALLFLIGKLVLSIIIAHNGAASAYGAAASLVSLLLWVYYSGQIIFIGAVGMKVYGFNKSISYMPKKHSLQRTTVTIDGGKYRGTLTEAWMRGFRKGSDRDK